MHRQRLFVTHGATREAWVTRHNPFSICKGFVAGSLHSKTGLDIDMDARFHSLLVEIIAPNT